MDMSGYAPEQGWEKARKDNELSLKMNEECTLPKNATHLSKISIIVDNELKCSICEELFIKTTTLSCSHSFCKYCITEWQKMKKDCPICRKSIRSMVPSIALDNFISQFVTTMDSGHQDARNNAEIERNALTILSKTKRGKRSSKDDNNRQHLSIQEEFHPFPYYQIQEYCFRCGHQGHPLVSCPF